MFACNDPDNGLFAGRVCQIEVGEDILMTLTAKNWNCVSFRGCPSLAEGQSEIRLSGRRWPIVASKDWLGNWCWNAYWMEQQVCRRFLVWLHGTGRFCFDLGRSELYDAWKAPAPLALYPDEEVPPKESLAERFLADAFGRADGGV